jgi:hypothetical protein
MAGPAAKYTGLSVALWPGQPLTNIDFADVTETWSAQWNDASSLNTAAAVAITVTDAWALSVTETSQAGTFSACTELSVGLLLPWAQRDQGIAKLGIGTNPVAVTDVWFASWTEDPFDSVFVDVWDDIKLTYGVESASVSLQFGLVPTDQYGLQWLDVAQVTVSGLVPLTVNDSWAIQFAPESALIASNQIDTSDAWSLSWQDTSAVAVAGVQINTSDNWALQLSAETGSSTVVGNIPIIASDEWDLTLFETSAVLLSGIFPKSASDQWNLTITDDMFLNSVVIRVQPRRRITVDGTIRHVDVE